MAVGVDGSGNVLKRCNGLGNGGQRSEVGKLKFEEKVVYIYDISLSGGASSIAGRVGLTPAGVR